MKNKKLINSFKYAFQGIGSAFISERNMKIHYTIMALVIIFGFLLKISMTEWIICIALFGLVISAEMFNTAIEYVVDIASPEKQEKAAISSVPDPHAKTDRSHLIFHARLRSIFYLVFPKLIFKYGYRL